MLTPAYLPRTNSGSRRGLLLNLNEGDALTIGRLASDDSRHSTMTELRIGPEMVRQLLATETHTHAGESHIGHTVATT